MRAFLWNKHGERRTHWVAWEKVCSPFGEGGLDIRTVKDTVYSQGKLAWKIIFRNTLWKKLLRQKYGTPDSSGRYMRQQSASLLWRKLYPQFQLLQECGRWCVGKGEISFWKTNWLGVILNSTNSSAIMVKEGLRELAKWKPAL